MSSVFFFPFFFLFFFFAILRLSLRELISVSLFFQNWVFIIQVSDMDMNLMTRPTLGAGHPGVCACPVYIVHAQHFNPQTS